jgi:adenylate cyclase
MSTPSNHPTPAEVRAALERILRSGTFEHAGRASEFLRFAVSETLAGRSERLKGYAIAVHVFGRPADFDAQSDPLVRVEALRLRQRLVEYYAAEGSDDPVRIELPRGGYSISATYAHGAAQPLAAAPVEHAAPGSRPRAFALGQGSHMWLAGAALAIVALGATALLREAPSVIERAHEPVARERAHKTRVVVVPMENLSANPEFGRLAASLTEEVLLRLDALDLFVVATQAQWYGTPSGLDDVLGKEHHYVLTGSIRDQGDGLRISVRIIEAETGTQLWSAAYDQPAGDEQFAMLQTRVARDVAAAAAPFGPVFDAELALASRSAHTLELPDCQNRYRAFRRATDPALYPEALACFQSLVARRPELAHAWAGLAMLFIDEHVFYPGNGGESDAIERAGHAVHTAIQLDSNNVLANAALTRWQYYTGDPTFVTTAEKALAIEPTNVDTMGLFGILLTAYGDATHGLELVQRAQSLALQPRGAFNIAYAFAHLRDDEPCKALAATERMDAPRWFITHAVAAAAAALCGDSAATAAAKKRLLSLSPRFESEALRLVGAWRFDTALHDAFVRGLREAGFDLPEHK